MAQVRGARVYAHLGMGSGSLKIYLGIGPGAGKTVAMLREGLWGHGRGTDVVVGYLSPKRRPLARSLLRNLEVVSPLSLTSKGRPQTEVDVDAIIRRCPEVCLMDELGRVRIAEGRPPWEEIEEIVSAGIRVLTTLNVQHIASLGPLVEAITGRQHENVPDRVVLSAAEIRLVDTAPSVIRRRIESGHVFPTGRTRSQDGYMLEVLEELRGVALSWLRNRPGV